MTREQLIEKVANAINNIEAKYMSPTMQHYKYAEAAINTIFDAIKEPSEEMVSAGNEYGAFIGAYGIWEAMLSASPLAPEE